MRGHLERELRRARLAGGTAPAAGAMFNPRAELQVLVQVLQGIYRDRKLDVALDAQDELLPFDREDMLEIAGNLADNACKWASSRVHLRAHADAAELRIEVADDGPGCSEDEAAAILGRGVRLDEEMPGHGLGLAIVRDAVEFYGGRLTLGRDPQLGGLLVRVALPLPSASDSTPG